MPVNMESITLDVSKQPLITPTLYLGQYDANGTTLTAEIYDNGTPLNLDNYGVRFCMRLPNEISYYSVDGTASGNVATINIDETFAATVPGFTDIAYIEVFSGETVICSTNRINVIVLENAKEGADPSQSHSSAIDEAIEAANSAALAANNAAADASTAAGNASESAENASDAAQAASEAAENVTTAATNATTAADSANTATTNANNAAQSASASATAADTAAESANDASARAEAAIEAIGDISELAVPLMSESTRGGATLGQGLTVDGGALSIGDVVTDETDGPIYSVDAKGWAEQDGTPTPDNPQEVRVARGRNLSQTADSTSYNFLIKSETLKPGTYVLSFDSTATSGGFNIRKNSQSGTTIGQYTFNTQATVRKSKTLTIDEECKLFINAFSVGINDFMRNIQLELGTTPTPYVPYGHVGLEVRDSSDELVSVTPIPLPAKGFAAALPDGTADALAIDSAGGYEWTNSTDEISLNGSEQWVAASGGDTGTYYIANNNIKRLSDYSNALMCDHLPVASSHGNTKNVTAISAYNGSSYVGRNWVYANVIGVTSASELAQFFTSHITALLYPLATPTTEHGYIDLPTIPEGATITIPELREVGVKCFVPGVSELIDHANNWGARCKENESRIAALEAAIANLATS